MNKKINLNGKQRFLDALNCIATDRPPIWMMRQAGRSLPEYRELKKEANFTDLVQNPELAAEITLQPIRRFNYDAAVIFSDILVVAEALGVPYQLRDTGGVNVDFKLKDEEDIIKLNPENATEKISYTPAAISRVKEQAEDRFAVIGFSGSPWTLASFMIEGGSSPDNLQSRVLIHEKSALFQQLLEKITITSIDYLNKQIKAGADAIQIFDSQGGTLCQSDYWKFSGKWIQKIVQNLKPKVPVTVFARGVHHNWSELIKTGANALSIDWNVDLSKISQKIPSSIALQGNLDPALLTASPSIATEQTKNILQSMKNRNGFIFNLGHGVPPNASIETINAVNNTVQSYGK